MVQHPRENYRNAALVQGFPKDCSTSSYRKLILSVDNIAIKYSIVIVMGKRSGPV